MGFGDGGGGGGSGFNPDVPYIDDNPFGGFQDPTFYPFGPPSGGTGTPEGALPPEGQGATPGGFEGVSPIPTKQSSTIGGPNPNDAAIIKLHLALRDIQKAKRKKQASILVPVAQGSVLKSGNSSIGSPGKPKAGG